MQKYYEDYIQSTRAGIIMMIHYIAMAYYCTGKERKRSKRSFT